MEPINVWNQTFLSEFIELYKTFPELWLVKSKDYSNRDKKNAALNNLLSKLHEIEPGATVADLKQKINSLRTSWRREHKKVLNSMRSGAGAEDIYEPSLWYYKSLEFIADQETPRPSKSNVGEDNLFQDSESRISDGDLQSDTDASLFPGTPASTDNSLQSSGFTFPKKRRRKKQGFRKNKEQSSHEELLHIIGEQIKKQAENPSLLDRFDHLGSNIAAKLRDLQDVKQRTIAEKLISDVLFQAEIGNLTEFSSILVQQSNPWQPAMSAPNPGSGGHRPMTQNLQFPHSSVASTANSHGYGGPMGLQPIFQAINEPKPSSSNLTDFFSNANPSTM